jgi:hypothetical protein
MANGTAGNGGDEGPGKLPAASGSGGAPVGGGGRSSGGAVAIDEFPAAFADVSCGRMFECCTAEELGMSPFGGSEQSCKSLFSSGLTQLVAPLKASLAAGRVTFDGVGLGDCLMAYGTTSCMELRDPDSMIESCEEFVTPKVGLDGVCEESYECIEGYCAVAGTCQVKKANGAPCSDEDDECQSGFCEVDRCAPPPAGEGGLCEL